MSLEKMDLAALKKSGYMKQRQEDLFAVRLRISCGNLTSDQLVRIGEIARKYGTGDVHLSFRQGIQIPNVHIKNLNAITEELQANGTPPGACGPRVRNVVACPGAHECNYGIIPTYDLGEMIDREFFGEDMPVKIKFGVTGCPNACARPQENDIGVMGVLKPAIYCNECVGCKTCTFVCPMKAIYMKDDRAEIDWDRCNLCGACVGICPQDLIREDWRGYRIFVGGKFGKQPQMGYMLTEVKTPEEVIRLSRKILDWSKENTMPGERFGTTINRLGLEKLKKDVLG